MKKNPKTVRFFFDDHVYRCRIFVCAGGDKLLFERFLDKKLGCNKSIVNAQEACAFLYSDSSDCGVWFRDIPGCGTVAHEALHLTSHILKKAGIVFSEDSEEAFAYHTGWVCSKIVEKVW